MLVDELSSGRRTLFRFVAVVIGLVVAGVAGYVGFVAFVGSAGSTAGGVMVLAAGTGFAAFFSPCSFPLLLTFLARRSAESPTAAVVSSVRVALGAGLLLLLIAVVIGLGGSALAGIVEFQSFGGRVFRLAIGIVLIVFGLRQARVWVFSAGWLDRVAAGSARLFDPSRVAGASRRDVVYGFGYLLAGFG